MGMYTEIFVNVDLKEDTPEEVIEVCRRACEKDYDWMRENGHPERWGLLFNDGSYYTPKTECGKLTKDWQMGYSLLGKGDIKNYEDEIEQFFEFIKPWVEDSGDKKFMGYSRYEDSIEPTLYYT